MTEQDIKSRKLTIQDVRYTPIVHLNENADARATIQIFCAAAVQSAKRGAIRELENNRDCVYITHRGFYEEAIKIVNNWFQIPNGKEGEE